MITIASFSLMILLFAAFAAGAVAGTVVAANLWERHRTAKEAHRMLKDCRNRTNQAMLIVMAKLRKSSPSELGEAVKELRRAIQERNSEPIEKSEERHA